MEPFHLVHGWGPHPAPNGQFRLVARNGEMGELYAQYYICARVASDALCCTTSSMCSSRGGCLIVYSGECVIEFEKQLGCGFA